MYVSLGRKSPNICNFLVTNMFWSMTDIFLTLIFNGLKMGKVFKSNTWLLILDPEVQLWNEKLKRLCENEKKQTITISQ